jgi:hypothetical protein
MNHLQAAGKAHILSKMIVAENKLQWRLSGRVSSRDGDCFLVEMSKYVRKYANGVSKESCEYSSHNASEKLYRTGTAPGLPPSPLGGGGGGALASPPGAGGLAHHRTCSRHSTLGYPSAGRLDLAPRYLWSTVPERASKRTYRRPPCPGL